MTDRQQAQLRMFRATLGVFRTHESIYQAVPALVKAHDALLALTEELDPTSPDQQHEPVSTVGTVKKSTKQTLALRANDVAALLYALADETKDVALLTESDYTERILYRKPDADLLRISQYLFQQATARQAALVPQGLEPDELANLAASIEQYKKEIGKPQTHVAQGAARTKGRRGKFREAMALLRNRLDKQMARFKTRAPEFYHAYQSARQIINTAARSAKEEAPMA